jgi:hypothetical protein
VRTRDSADIARGGADSALRVVLCCAVQQRIVITCSSSVAEGRARNIYRDEEGEIGTNGRG